MSSYGSGGGIDYGSSQEKGRVMEQVRNQIAVATLQELIMVCELRLVDHLIISSSLHRKCLTNVSESVYRLQVLVLTTENRLSNEILS